MADLPLLSPGARGASLLIQIYLLITAVDVLRCGRRHEYRVGEK